MIRHTRCYFLFIFSSLYICYCHLFLSLYFIFKSISHRYFFFFFCYFTIAAVLRRFYHCLSRYLCAPIWWWCLHAPTFEVAQDNHIWLKFLFKILWGFAYKYISVQIEKYFEIRHTHKHIPRKSLYRIYSFVALLRFTPRSLQPHF